MPEVFSDQIERAWNPCTAGTATLIQSVPVKETFEGKTVWGVVVHVFTAYGHPKVNKANAWSSPIDGSDKRRFFAVLHLPPITSSVEAVRAAVVAEKSRNT